MKLFAAQRTLEQQYNRQFVNLSLGDTMTEVGSGIRSALFANAIIVADFTEGS